MKKRISMMLAGIALAIVCVWCGNIEAKAGNTMLTAETMALNSSVTGTVNYRTQEYYKLTLSQNTQIQMELHTATADDKAYVRIYDSNAEEIYYSGAYFYTTDDNNWGVQRAERTVSLNKGTYYFEVGTAHTSHYPEYTLEVTSIAKTTDTVKVAGDQNNYRANAVKINLGNKLSGTAEWVNSNWDECHWYRFSLSSKKKIYLNCSTPITKDNEKVWVGLFDASGKRLYQVVLNSRASLESFNVDYETILSSGTYYIGISTPDSAVPYTVKTAVQPISTKINSVSRGAKYFTVKWAAKSNVTGYQIQYSTKSSFANAKCVNIAAGNTSKKVTGLTSGKKYYVRVRTYKKSFDKTYYSNWSTKSTVTPKPYATKIAKLTRGNDCFTVKWAKKTDITGYQIQYSTSSSFSNAKSVKVKAGTLSKKVTKLKNTKKYYVRIRTYKTVSGNTTYSAWCAKKTVITK